MLLLARPARIEQEGPCRVPLTVSQPAPLPCRGRKAGHAERAGRGRFAGPLDVPGVPGCDGAAAGAADGGRGRGAVGRRALAAAAVHRYLYGRAQRLCAAVSAFVFAGSLVRAADGRLGCSEYAGALDCAHPG